jgi:hypothetical protein
MHGEAVTAAVYRAKFPGTTDTKFSELRSAPEVKEALEVRGLSVGATPVGVLTEEQLTVANVLLDHADKRSQTKKLSDLGIPTLKFQGWMRDPTFSGYLTTRAEHLTKDRLFDVHGGLVDRAAAGDVNAVKLYYELTGRHVSGSTGGVDLALVLVKIIEILQKHVQDPVILTAVSDELLNVIDGEVERKQIG